MTDEESKGHYLEDIDQLIHWVTILLGLLKAEKLEREWQVETAEGINEHKAATQEGIVNDQ